MTYIYTIDELALRAEEPTPIPVEHQIMVAIAERLEEIAKQLERLADMQRRGT